MFADFTFLTNQSLKVRIAEAARKKKKGGGGGDVKASKHRVLEMVT